MCNCNQQRLMYSNTNETQKGMVRVKLVEDKAIVLNGSITGRTYIFRQINDINWVDKRDAMSLTESLGLQVI